MNLAPDQAKLFYELYAALLSFVNQRLEVSPVQFSNSDEYAATPPEDRVAIRTALFEHRELIDEFVSQNPANLLANELEIVSTWKHALPGNFFIFRYLKKHMIFLTSVGSPRKAYGVLGLVDPMEELIGPHLPQLIATVLLPFRGKIIYDGLISGKNITFGGGIKRMLNEEYKQAKEAFGIITALGDQAAPLPEKKSPSPGKGEKKPKRRSRKSVTGAGSRSASAQAKAIAEQLIEMTDDFCRKHLNEEYAELCRKLAWALARKRPSPLLRGRLQTWAVGIVRTIGWVNYLDDPGQEPHLRLPFIDQAFGVAESTGQGKSKAIRTMFRIRPFDHKWTLPSKMDDGPMIWTVDVNGLPVDVRRAPREVQQAAFEMGMIPYVPADRAETGEEK